MGMIDFVGVLHRSTKRNYKERVLQHDKAECAAVAKKFGSEYWDGDRKYGYGGFHYDGRWTPVAETLIKHYDLKPGDKVLDVGCGKAFLLYEMQKIMPELIVCGVDISEYALKNAPKEIQPVLQLGSATKLDFPDHSFDLVISITTLHNLYLPDLFAALREIVRVGRNKSYIVVESYRNECEKANLLYWQLTCESFFTPDEWDFIYSQTNYKGDFSYIYFE